MKNKSHIGQPLLLYIFQSIIIGVILYFGFDLSPKNVEVPFVFSGDVFHHLTVTKAIVDSGWWWTIDHLSAPFTLNMVSFSPGGTLDYFIIKMISLFNTQPGAVLNLFWLLTFVLTGMTAMWSLKRLGISRSISFSIGILYAFLPHAFSRNEGHLMLVYYLVPLVSSFAIIIIRDKFYELDKKEKLIYYSSCIAIGFNYIYTAFFSMFLLLIAGLISLFNRGWSRSASAALTALCIILISAIINLSPMIYSWKADPAAKDNIQAKHAAEADTYGLKMRHLLTPIYTHPLPLWRLFAEKTFAANYPLENENSTERLGTIGSIGFLLLVAISIVGLLQIPKQKNILLELQPIASLNLSAFLLATIGGFGSIFNLLISSDIRAYNRIAVFIAFFSFVAISILLSSTERKIKIIRYRLVFYSFLILMTGLGIFDQTLFADITSSHTASEQQYAPLKQFVEDIEKQLPNDAMIYQMPYVPYPNTPVLYRMQSHQHLAPYLVSKHLRWSWPSLSGKSLALAGFLSATPPSNNFIQALIAVGYDGIWVDRYGYEDNGEKIIFMISSLVNGSILESPDKRFVFISLQEEKKKLLETDISKIRELRRRLLNLRKMSRLSQPLPETAFSIKLIIENPPSMLKVSEKAHVNVKVENTSLHQLPSGGYGKYSLALSYRWKAITGKQISGYESRTCLPEDLEPKGETLVSIPVIALNMPGEYILEFDMVQELVAWFGDRGSKTAVTKVRIRDN